MASREAKKRPLLNVARLTAAAEEKVLASRRESSREAERAAARIVADVRKRGDAALFAWTARFDQRIDARSLWAPAAELKKAQAAIDKEFLAAIDHAARNIRAVAERQKPQEWTFEVEPGVRAGQRVRPLESVGCYLPGGRFSLVSTMLMTVIPAQVAGVREIIVASPQPGEALLAAAARLGIRRVARVGGAQAIAAMAYGTESIPRVDKICGPGNRFVAAAKKIVSGDCSIDMLAGPTEAIVYSSKGDARYIAADLIAQAEHDPDAIAIFVTTSAALARAVAEEIDRQIGALPKANLARRALARNGAILVASNERDAVRFINRFAPEHLTVDDEATFRGIDSAGSVFVGRWSAQSFGDYASGTNHVLPTSGAARTRGGLSAADFVKCISVQEVSQAGVARLAPVVEQFARAEGLEAHARSVGVRQ